MTTKHNVKAADLSILDQVRSIALEGLKYAKDPYDIARYSKLADITASEYSDLLEIDLDQVMQKFRSEFGTVTPKVGADAAVISDNGKILALKRTDDQSWCLPCGWVDVGESPADAAIRETKEETGLDVEPLGYITVSHKGPHTASHLQHQVNVITLMKPVNQNTEIVLSHEHSEYMWVTPSDTLNWHIGHDKQFERVIKHLESNRQKLLDII